MHPSTGELPWWAWLFPAAFVAWIVGGSIRLWWRGELGIADEAVSEPVAGQLLPEHLEIWARVVTGDLPRLARPRDVPRPESVEEVAKWEDPDGFGRTELIYAPIFWVLLPLAALGFLIHEAITDPTGADWSITINDQHVDSWPMWIPWVAWVGVGIWLLIAVGVLFVRASVTAEVRADNQWIYERGIPYSIHRSPRDTDDGEGGTWPTFIAIDHRLSDLQATRVHAALEAWLSADDVQGSQRPWQKLVSSEELFGEDAAGGCYLHSIPGIGTADEFEAHQWVLITEPRDSEGEVTVTTVPLEKKLRRIRAKLRRKTERREPA